MLAYIAPTKDDHPYEVAYGPDRVLELCAGCIYKLVRLAGLLLKLEARPKPPKKPRNRAQSRQTAPLPHPSPEHTSSLVPDPTV